MPKACRIIVLMLDCTEHNAESHQQGLILLKPSACLLLLLGWAYRARALLGLSALQCAVQMASSWWPRRSHRVRQRWHQPSSVKRSWTRCVMPASPSMLSTISTPGQWLPARHTQPCTHPEACQISTFEQHALLCPVLAMPCSAHQECQLVYAVFCMLP